MSEEQLNTQSTINDRELLDSDEVLLIVDDSQEIVNLLRDFLQGKGFSVHAAASAEELRQQLVSNKVALVLLDIGLPDGDGTTLLPGLKDHYPDMAVIMLTAVTDLQTALACLRCGADDYLAKPVRFADLLGTLRRVLERRRLSIKNKQYQKEIERATFRLRLMHSLTMKLNTAYLTIVELGEILHVVLAGITADEGLQFNRAFLALLNDEGTVLEGRLAIGPGTREDGSRIWRTIQEQSLSLQDILSQRSSRSDGLDAEVNRIVRALQVKTSDTEHILIRALQERQTINVVDGRSFMPVPPDLMGLLQEDTFVITPLYSTSRPLGILIADHFITGHPITEESIHDLESLASQASLAIEHCHLHAEMRQKIKQLEELTNELEKNKDLLIEAERYSAVGHMAAHLAHSLRNPITAIGGTARLLARKTANSDWLQFLGMMTGEVEKIEKTLEDLFNFVNRAKPVFQEMPLLELLRRSMLLYFNSMDEIGIKYALHVPEIDPIVHIDPRLIQQALVHLIKNSIEAMPLGGELSMQLLLQEQKVEIVLSDTGHGLGSADPQRVTDPFFTTKVVGTGMGLTLVRSILEDHQGSLILRKRSGGGTEVVMILPRIG